MPSARVLTGESLANAIYKITDKLEEEFVEEFILQARKLSRGKSLQQLLDQIEGGYFTSISSIPASLSLIKINTAKLDAIVRKAMGSSARITNQKVGLNISFNVRNPTIIETARNMSVELSTNLSKTSQKILDKVIADAMEGLVTRREAIKIIESRVGLLPAHSDAVDRYYKTLVDSGATKAMAKKLSDEYADRLLKYRANTIARTEIARATGIGQTEYWRQAMDEGAFPPDTKRVWITGYDERVCEICEPMNDSEVGIFEQWLTPNGFVDYPSAIHPNCRCSQGIALSASQKRMFVGKSDAEQFDNYVLSKFNPNHDELGRFTFASGGRKLVSRKPKETIRSYKSKKGVTVIDQGTPKATDINFLDRTTTSAHGTSAKEKKFRDIARNIFQVKLETPKGDIFAEIDIAYRDLKDDLVSVKGRIMSSSDGKIGRFEVTIDTEKKDAEFDYISVDPSFQGLGIGTALTAHWEDQLSRAGVKTTSLYAVSGPSIGFKYNGAYTWATLGYKPYPKSAQQIYQNYVGLLSNGGKQNKKAWGLRRKLIEDLGITSDEDASDMLSDTEIVRAITKKYRNNFLKLMSYSPLFKDYLRGEIPEYASSTYIDSASWSGTKPTRKISKAVDTELDIVNRWMRTNPAGLENDDSLFWKEIENFYLKNSVSTPEDIEKFNPYHDELGRFTSGPSGRRISAKPKMTRRQKGIKGTLKSLIRYSSKERKLAVEKLALEGSDKLLGGRSASGVAQVLSEKESSKRYGSTLDKVVASIEKLGVKEVKISKTFGGSTPQEKKDSLRQAQAMAQVVEEAKAMGISIKNLSIDFTTRLTNSDAEYDAFTNDPKMEGNLVIDKLDRGRIDRLTTSLRISDTPRISSAPTVAETKYTSDYTVIDNKEDFIAKYAYAVAIHEMGHHFTYKNSDNPNAIRQYKNQSTGIRTPANYGNAVGGGNRYEMLAESFTAWWLLGGSKGSLGKFYQRWLPFVQVALNGNDAGFGGKKLDLLLKSSVRKIIKLNVLGLPPTHPIIAYLTNGASIPEELKKFNPNHDELGRFTFASGNERSNSKKLGPGGLLFHTSPNGNRKSIEKKGLLANSDSRLFLSEQPHFFDPQTTDVYVVDTSETNLFPDTVRLQDRARKSYYSKTSIPSEKVYRLTGKKLDAIYETHNSYKWNPETALKQIISQ